MATASVTSVDLTGLKKIGQGKVRDVFEVDDKTLLFVASDRVSAFDVVMKNGIPDKGAILTHASVRLILSSQSTHSRQSSLLSSITLLSLCLQISNYVRSYIH